MVMSSLRHQYGSMQANGVIHGEKWMSVGSDGMSKMISLYSIYSHVLFSQFDDDDQRTKFLVKPTL